MSSRFDKIREIKMEARKKRMEKSAFEEPGKISPSEDARLEEKELEVKLEKELETPEKQEVKQEVKPEKQEVKLEVKLETPEKKQEKKQEVKLETLEKKQERKFVQPPKVFKTVKAKNIQPTEIDLMKKKHAELKSKLELKKMREEISQMEKELNGEKIKEPELPKKLNIKSTRGRMIL